MTTKLLHSNLLTRRIRRLGLAAALGLCITASANAGTNMRGVNMSGAEWGSLPGTLGTSYTYNSAKSFQYFGGKGLTLIRVCIGWEHIQPTLNGALDTANLNALKNDIAWAKTYGCKVVIDVHNYARYSINESGTYNTYIIDNVYNGVTKVSSANLSNLWVQLSNQFKNETGVYAYGMMNEPHDMGTANWHTISQTVLTAIRNNGDNKLIMVPGNAWTGASNWAGNNGSTSWISDPANNFKYEAHEYFDHDGSGTYNESYDTELANNPNLPTVGVTRLQGFVEWCFNNGVQGYLGEYGVSNADSRWFTVLQNFLNALDAANFDGTYWAGGEWWGSYPLSIQPSNNFTTDAPVFPT
ncbi:MAG TPA: glycoside hydrolase family 5 protein, partial [Chthoniobacteraceae bacterium]